MAPPWHRGAVGNSLELRGDRKPFPSRRMFQVRERLWTGPRSRPMLGESSKPPDWRRRPPLSSWTVVPELRSTSEKDVED